MLSLTSRPSYQNEDNCGIVQHRLPCAGCSHDDCSVAVAHLTSGLGDFALAWRRSVVRFCCLSSPSLAVDSSHGCNWPPLDQLSAFPLVFGLCDCRFPPFIRLSQAAARPSFMTHPITCFGLNVAKIRHQQLMEQRNLNCTKLSNSHAPFVCLLLYLSKHRS